MMLPNLSLQYEQDARQHLNDAHLQARLKQRYGNKTHQRLQSVRQRELQETLDRLGVTSKPGYAEREEERKQEKALSIKTGISTKENAHSDYHLLLQQERNKKRSSNLFKSTQGEEEARRRKRRRLDELDNRNRRIYHYIKPSPVQEWEKADFEFAPLSRPSRINMLRTASKQARMRIKNDKAIAFLIRPIRQNAYRQAFQPEEVTEEHVQWALQQYNIHGRSILIPSNIVEFMVFIDWKYARPLPQRKDPLLESKASDAIKQFGKALPPLLVEKMEKNRSTTSKLLYFDGGNIDNNDIEPPHFALHRNATHVNKDKQIVLEVQDRDFQPIRFEGHLSPKSTNSTVVKCHTKAALKAADEANIAFGMKPHWANVVLNWSKVKMNEVQDEHQAMPLGTIKIVDSIRDEDDGEIEHTFVKYQCSTACFAENDVCGDCIHADWKPKYGDESSSSSSKSNSNNRPSTSSNYTTRHFPSLPPALRLPGGVPRVLQS